MIITGCGEYGGMLVKTFQIKPVKLSKVTATLKSTALVYTGKVLTPVVKTVKGGSQTFTAKNYRVTCNKTIKEVGAYTLTVTVGPNYIGTGTVTVKVNPKATTLSSVTAASKGFTVKWKKQATQTTGYQIQYSTSSTFKSGNKTVLITKNSTLSKKITGLKAKKKYYVRIRTYKTVSGKKYYSTWSVKKTVTTKK